MSATGSVLPEPAVSANLPASVGSPLTSALGNEIPRFKVAMIAACPMPSRRGTPLRIERLTEALIARGHHVEMITYHVSDDDQQLPFPVHRIFKKRVYERMPAGPNLRKLALYDPALTAKVWEVLAKASPRFDVIHAHHLEGLLVSLPSRVRFGVPVVYDAHTMLSSELPSYGPSITKRVVSTVGRWFDGLIPSTADHVASVTVDIRDRLIERHKLSPEHISVVTNGVETEVFKVPAQPRNDGLTRLIYTGTLAPYQDVDLLLEAFALAYKQRADLRLVMAVSNPFEPYEALANKLGIRQALEIVPDKFSQLPRQLAESAMAVVPRMHCDGIPQKLLNYMAAGKATLSSAGSAKVMEDGLTGVIIPNGDVKGFAAAIVRLAADPVLRERIGKAAQDYVETNYSWDGAAQRLEQIYQRLVPARA